MDNFYLKCKTSYTQYVGSLEMTSYLFLSNNHMLYVMGNLYFSILCDFKSQTNLPEEKPRQIFGLSLPGAFVCQVLFFHPFIFPQVVGNSDKCYLQIVMNSTRDARSHHSVVNHCLLIYLLFSLQRRSYRVFLLVLIYLIPRKSFPHQKLSFFLLCIMPRS